MIVPEDPYYNTISQVLQDSPLFGKLSPEVRQSVIEQSLLQEWKKGADIDPDLCNQYAFIIIEGKVKLTHIDPNTGRSVVLFLLKPGDIFDVLPLLDGKEHIVFPSPVENSKLLYAPLQQAREWISTHPEFNATFLPYLGQQMREIEHFNKSLVFYDISTRLAHLILHHTHQCKDEDQKHYPVHLINNLSHESLAQMIGSVRSVITGQIKKFKEEDIIVSKRGKLAVKNLEKLIQKCDPFLDHNQ